MSVLAALDVTKTYGDRLLLAGAETPDTGSVATRRGARVAYLAQEPDLDESKTVRASVEEGLDAWINARNSHEAIAGGMRHVVVQEKEHELRGSGESRARGRRRLAHRAAGAGAVRAA